MYFRYRLKKNTMRLNSFGVISFHTPDYTAALKHFYKMLTLSFVTS